MDSASVAYSNVMRCYGFIPLACGSNKGDLDQHCRAVASVAKIGSCGQLEENPPDANKRFSGFVRSFRLILYTTVDHPGMEQSGSNNGGREEDGHARSSRSTLSEGFRLQEHEDPWTVRCLEPDSSRLGYVNYMSPRT
jgi:hypothetical protein